MDFWNILDIQGLKQSIILTYKKRPDLLKSVKLSEEDKKTLKNTQKNIDV